MTLKVTNNTQETVTFDLNTDDRWSRFEIFGLLQDQARCITAEFG